MEHIKKTSKNVNNKKDLIMLSLNKFFAVNDNLKQLLPIINGKSGPSLRIIDWFVTNYSKKNKTIYYLSREKKSDGPKYSVEPTEEYSDPFMVFHRYRSQLNGFQKKRKHITDTPKKFLKDKFNLDIHEDPKIQIDHHLISESSKKFQINKNELNILLGIGGSGPTKRIPAKTFVNVIKIMSKKKKCKFFLATGKDNDEQLILNEILNSKFGDLCVPLDNLSIKETLPIISNCNLSICNDSSFSHLSAALGVRTITLMADTPLIYGNYSSIMFPIIPEGERAVSHNTLGKEKISSEKILNKIYKILD